MNRGEIGPGARAALFAGTAAAFVAGVGLVAAVRPALLLDAEPSWLPARLLLTAAVLAGTVGVGVLVAAGMTVAAGAPRLAAPIPALPFSRLALLALAAGAVLLGTAVRSVHLEEIPASLWLDDLSLIRTALDLRGAPADFADASRPSPSGVAKPYGTVGVLYLEAYRAALRVWGTTVFGVRFPSLAAGILSLVTAPLLARELLPRGGGALAAVALAGLRWSLILSRWGWVAVVLAPLADAAALLLARARRRRSAGLAAAAGAVAGIGVHVYLSGWIVFAALLAFALWPGGGVGGARGGLLRAALFAAAFAAVAAPLFLLHEGRSVPYFARASDHNVLREIRTRGTLEPLGAAVSDALLGPWLVPDPSSRNDLPGRSRLGWILGVPVAAIAVRSLLRPRDEISGFLLAHAGAALLASAAGGEALSPNGYRFAYLADVAAVASAAGALWLLGLVPAARRRASATAAVGLFAISGALGARDALVLWPGARATFDGFHGQDTLIGRSARRWERFGPVVVSGRVGQSPEKSPITIDAIRRYALDPGAPRRELAPAGPPTRERAFRIEPPGTRPSPPGERLVERVGDAWGREWAVVLGGGAREPERRP